MTYFNDFGKSILPEKIRLNIKTYLSKTGENKVPYGLYAKLFLLSIVLIVIIYALLIFPILKSQPLPNLIITSFIALTIMEFVIIILLIFFMWIYYEFVIFRRTMKIEEVLPDFLEGVSVNLKAGMSFDKALWNSVGPGFGVLEKEIEMVSKKVMAGEDTELALKEFSEKYNSLLLQESMDMIIIGLKSGGSISELIDRIVDNVKEAYFLRKEIIASVTSYVIFIFVTAIVISPVLFALSFNLMEIMQSLGEKLTTNTNFGSIPSLGTFKGIDAKDFVLFSKFAVVVIAIFSSMIIAELREGSIKAGIKYLFIFVPIAYVVYMVMFSFFTSAFGVLI